MTNSRSPRVTTSPDPGWGGGDGRIETDGRVAGRRPGVVVRFLDQVRDWSCPSPSLGDTCCRVRGPAPQWSGCTRLPDGDPQCRRNPSLPWGSAPRTGCGKTHPRQDLQVSGRGVVQSRKRTGRVTIQRPIVVLEALSVPGYLTCESGTGSDRRDHQRCKHCDQQRSFHGFLPCSIRPPL